MRVETQFCCSILHIISSTIRPQHDICMYHYKSQNTVSHYLLKTSSLLAQCLKSKTNNNYFLNLLYWPHKQYMNTVFHNYGRTLSISSHNQNTSTISISLKHKYQFLGSLSWMVMLMSTRDLINETVMVLVPKINDMVCCITQSTSDKHHGNINQQLVNKNLYNTL